MKQLLIGPRKFKKSNITGGEVILFENWINYCIKNNHSFDVIDANKGNYPNTIIALLKIYWQLLTKTCKNDIVFLQGSKNDYFFIAPFAALVCKIFNKPLFLRKFAGEFDKDFEKASFLKKRCTAWTMRKAQGLFWEVKRLLPFGSKFNKKCYWFPNNREKGIHKRSSEEVYNPTKFVFISQVRKEKGIDELLEAFRILGSEYDIDIYGPLIGYKPEDLNGHYKGQLEPEEVSLTLSKYQILVLPSSWKEGYPGIIIEAFNSGLPTIATPVGGIPEMIEDGVNGLLCDSSSPKDIIKAIKRLESLDFKILSENALSSFASYDSSVVNKGVYDILNSSLKK